MAISDKTNVSKRSEKSVPLTQVEVDQNFQEVRNVIDDSTALEQEYDQYVTDNDQRVSQVEQDVTDLEGSRTFYVNDLAELKGLDFVAGTHAFLTQEGRSGNFVAVSGNQTSNITKDPQEGVWVAPSSDASGASGAWKRAYEGTINVMWFGTVGDGIADDTVPLQAAVDFSQSSDFRGSHLYWPSGRYLGNVIDDGGYDIKWTGDGLTNTYLFSAAPNEFFAKLERTFRSTFISDLRFDGTDKTKHGLYVNTGSEVRLTNVEFGNCGLGYVCNSTINNTYNQCVWRDNYVSAYFTTRKTGGTFGLSVPDVNGQIVTLTDAFFESHPSVSHFNGCLVKTSTIGFIADDGDNGFQQDCAYSMYDTNFEANDISIIYEDGFGTLANYRCPYHLSCWMEGNGASGDVVFNGVTYPQAITGEVIQKSGFTIWENMKLASIYLDNNAVMELKSCGFQSENAKVVTNGQSSIFADMLYGENAKITGANMIAKAVMTGSVRATVYKTPLVQQTAYNPAAEFSTQDFVADGAGTYGTVTTTDVVDGVFDTEECKEHSSSTHGPTFCTATKVTGKYLVALFTAKWISGDTNWILSAINAESPAGSGGTLTFSDKWETYALVNKFAEDGTGGTNFIKPADGTTSVIRTSGRCSLVFNTLREVKEFFDARNFALIR